MSEADCMDDGEDYLKEGCQRQTCDGCMAYNYCLIKENRRANNVSESKRRMTLYRW